MPFLRALPSRRCLLLTLIWACLAAFALPPAAWAARATSEVGMKLLKAEIPVGASLQRLSCEQISNAVHAATLAHRANAVQVMVAGLSLNEWDAKRKKEFRLDCPCVLHIFNAAASAAPDRASALLETAQALYPECAEGLTAALGALEQRIVVKAGDDGDGPGDGFGNGAGSGPGFTGAPGFGGSAPGGGGFVIMPPPAGAVVTAAANN